MTVVKFALFFALISVLLYFILTSWESFDPESVRGKRVLITGASSGIGEELAYRYSKLGASVLITARRESHLRRVATKCKQLGAKQVEYVAADMGSAEQRKKVVDQVEKRFGGLDHLILNHAVFSFEHWQYTEKNLTTLENDMNVNFFAFVDIVSKCYRMLRESGGNIGVVSSVAGKVASPLQGYYGSTKFALEGFFAVIQEELILSGGNVSVTVFPLGLIRTEMAVKIFETVVKNNSKDFDYLYSEVEETATRIIEAVTLRDYEAYYPKFWYYAIMFHRMAPQFFNQIWRDYRKSTYDYSLI